MKIRKGYVFIILFSLVTSVGHTLYYAKYISRYPGSRTLGRIFLQSGILFLLFFIPGIFVVRWYYRNKALDLYDDTDHHEKNPTESDSQ